jgi:Sulfotransferase family
MRLSKVGYDPAKLTKLVNRSVSAITPAVVAGWRDVGCPAPDPIFIVGLPRSGSTLIEQILSSHSLIEGTMELPNIMTMASQLGGTKGRHARSSYPEALMKLSAEECRALGERYLADTRIQRKTSKPFFIDKMPNNFQYLAFIKLILPNAKIIDARRHPLSCCFSGYKQNFAQGQRFTYSLDNLAKYYCDYVRLMAHFDSVLPGAVHRVIYERMVQDTETEVRRLLDYLGVPFEAGCLKFYENDRAVRTPSAQQVRQPIYRDAMEQWRNYDPWLSPLKLGLGEVLDRYPDTPEYSSA